MIQYRTFRNTDPPHLVGIWNDAFPGRGAVRLRNASPLELAVFSKPYFDPAGLVVAWDGTTAVGFGHAGFGSNPTESALDPTQGVTCLLGVRPSHQRRGIGTELLRRCETYLSGRGATRFFAGALHPFNPFYFGTYGGSEQPGLLVSDGAAEPFFLKHGYQVHDTSLIFQRNLNRPLGTGDLRFANLRRLYEVRVVPRAGIRSWWQECVLGAVELADFQMEEKSTGQVVAHSGVWEMEGFSWRWNQPAVGVVEFVVRADLRRQGIGKFLLAHVLRYLQEQYFSVAEVQTMKDNAAAIGLYKGLGFEQVDAGRIYKKPVPAL